MIRPLLLVCAAVLIGALSIFAYTEREPRADLTYVNPSGVHTLDPARMTWNQDFRIALNIWEGLTTWHPRTVEPIEAAAYLPPHVSDDGLTYTFTIRDDARWSNGDSVTAADFVRGWRRSMEPGTGTDYTFLFTNHIAGAEEYVAWRRESVDVLTALDLLRAGANITARQAQVLASHPKFARLLEPKSIDAVWVGRELADGFLQARADWHTLHDQWLSRHASELDSRFAGVGVSAKGERTLAVRLNRPCFYFLDLTGLPPFLPCHESIERLRERYRGAPITAQGLVVYDPQWVKPDYHGNGYPGLTTNGAYRLADWIFKRRIRLIANPFDRRAGTLRCRTVDMLEYENVTAAIMAYEAGQVDFLPDMNVPYDHELARLARTGERPDFHPCVLLATYFFNFNCVSPTAGDRLNPFTDRRVRRAFSLAIDKDQLVQNVLKRGDRVAHSLVPAAMIPGYQPPTGTGMDVGEAQELLAQAGFPAGAGLPPVEILYLPSDERVCQAIARMWEKSLGVRVELRGQESKTFAEEKANQHFMVARGNWYADYNDPTTFLDCLTTGNGNNDSGYSNPRYNELLVAANMANDPVERAAVLQEAERIIVEVDFPILPILHYAELIAIKPHVAGLYPNARLWFPFYGVDPAP